MKSKSQLNEFPNLITELQMNKTPFRCLKVREAEPVSEASEKNNTSCQIESETFDQLKSKWPDSVEAPLVRVRLKYSSLNFKDGLAIQGHPGIAKRLPLIPGIDGAGIVDESTGSKFKTGDEVMIFHARFGTETNGAFSEYAYVPESWLYALPSGLSLRDTMILGTAGFTAAQCVDELQKHYIAPDQGEIVVSGATGGVGIFAVKLLARLGYQVVASTGKAERAQWLKHNGATQVISRQELNDESARPMLKSRWAGAVDTVGGNTLGTIIRGTKGFGCVTACGLVGGTDLPVSVYPFILRGVTLQGVDTANISYERRESLWTRLGADWHLDGLDELTTEVDMDGIVEEAGKILAGQIAGRTVIRL